jgi:hypothetical protein
MPNISEMRESKFLRQTDIGKGALCTITGCVQVDTAKEGAEPHMKWCLTFAEQEKPLVLNMTNAQVCAKVFGSEDSDDWIGKRIVLYTDPNVSFQGKLVGGIRCRAPKPGTAPAAPPVNHSAPVTEDEIPF